MEAKDESLMSTGAFLKMKRCCGGIKEEPAEHQLVLKKKHEKSPNYWQRGETDHTESDEKGHKSRGEM